MESVGVCRNPVCKDCDENEYMDTYNTERICERQPYCNPNSNFKWPESTSKTKKHQCQCKEGFHCSSPSCFTCDPHTECEPGYKAAVIGSHSRDTVCEECPSGTFSDEKSWNSTCKERSWCYLGSTPKDNENICGHEHVGVIAAVILLVLVAGTIVGLTVLYFKRTGKTGHAQLTTTSDTNGDVYKVDMEDEEKTYPFITNPTEDREEVRSPLQESVYSSGTPEENEDVVFTERGKVLSQDGKEHHISQPETQAMTVK